jgi:hypothetical protein
MTNSGKKKAKFKVLNGPPSKKFDISFSSKEGCVKKVRG